jgi:hypothetical protein
VKFVYSKVSKLNVSLAYTTITVCCRQILFDSKKSLGTLLDRDFCFDFVGDFDFLCFFATTESNNDVVPDDSDQNPLCGSDFL